MLLQRMFYGTNRGFMSDPIWIPENKHGIEEGAYSNNEIVELLRDNCKKPKVIYFLADMLEE